MNNFFQGRKILLCITGGIAAYKIPALVRLITKSENEIEIIMTKSAENFAAPMALATLAKKNVFREEDFNHTIPHVKLSQWADVIVIAPCSANTLAKIACGIADNLLTSAIIAAKCPVIIFPAMNENMYDNPATQENILTLKNRGIKIISPDEGELACGVSGRGRMPEPQNILREIFRALCPVKDMAGKNILVTAGATHEYLDPVRYISNPSTGKMGVAMARAAWYRGANVKIVAGEMHGVDTYGLEVIKIISALDMLAAVRENLAWADVIVKAAAVGDYRAKEISGQKIKREGKEIITLELLQNPDIAAEIGKIKRDDQILIGFAAESENILQNARKKLSRKNLDYILANDITGENSGFASDTNTLRLIPRDEKKSEKIFTGLKENIAFDIWSDVLSV